MSGESPAQRSQPAHEEAEPLQESSPAPPGLCQLLPCFSASGVQAAPWSPASPPRLSCATAPFFCLGDIIYFNDFLCFSVFPSGSFLH